MYDYRLFRLKAQGALCKDKNRPGLERSPGKLRKLLTSTKSAVLSIYDGWNQ
jgi:hypothetical protein